MGLNTYMYAPKDDCKHRAHWRDLYSVEEAGEKDFIVFYLHMLHEHAGRCCRSYSFMNKASYKILCAIPKVLIL